MTLDAFFFNGTIDIAYLEDKHSSKEYIEVLYIHLLLIDKTLDSRNNLCQHDNASKHINNSHIKTHEKMIF